MNAYKELTFLIILAAGLLPACRVLAQTDAGDGQVGPRQGFSVGGRGAYYRPEGTDHGDFSEGAQARFHFTPSWAVEGSVDLRQNRFGEAKVDMIPLQLSLMVYLMPPGYRFVPYVLAGGGWYYTHVYAPVNHSEFRFGPHMGAGADFFLDRSWSIDSSYRYLWTEDIHSQDVEHPLGRNFRDKGFMITVALNYYF
ncbi:MAG: hypothetical protein A2218_01800 [Elusimicrobia bacterium RIFOXYA2_FULL_53_38]|nr:MAG: hypothetical protein A2218_01800 [Elusimicrobia bacterium RIFOXYA2_FULL_53_38]